MRLKDRSRSPVGGFSYDDPITNRVIVTQGGFNKLLAEVKQWHAAQGVKSPPELESMIENQICDRQPKDRCYKRGLGDLVASGVQMLAGAVDAVAGTTLQKKAKRCGGCSKRRVMLNS
jgi:hypothetical protein